MVAHHDHSGVCGAATYHAYDLGRKHEADLHWLQKHVTEHKACNEKLEQTTLLLEDADMSLYECRHDMRKHLAAVVGVLGCEPPSGIVLLEKED